jgi:hypothetical protein
VIKDYENLNREETIAAVDDFGAEQLQEFIQFERSHKNRITVVEPLERELVTVRPTTEQPYVAGIWFDDPSQAKTVRRSTRIDQALGDGDLEEVDRDG